MQLLAAADSACSASLLEMRQWLVRAAVNAIHDPGWRRVIVKALEKRAENELAQHGCYLSTGTHVQVPFSTPLNARTHSLSATIETGLFQQGMTRTALNNLFYDSFSLVLSAPATVLWLRLSNGPALPVYRTGTRIPVCVPRSFIPNEFTVKAAVLNNGNEIPMNAPLRRVPATTTATTRLLSVTTTPTYRKWTLSRPETSEISLPPEYPRHLTDNTLIVTTPPEVTELSATLTLTTNTYKTISWHTHNPPSTLPQPPPHPTNPHLEKSSSSPAPL